MRLSSANPKYKKRPNPARIKPLLLLPLVSAATQLHLQYKPGLLFLSSADFLPGPGDLSFRAGQMQGGRLRHGGRFARLRYRDQESLAHGPGFVNARGALRASRERLSGPGHTIMGGQALSMPFDHTAVTLPAHRWPASEGSFRISPGRIE